MEKTIMLRIAQKIVNWGPIFYDCPDHEKDGSGCDFWC
ncbi:hypothetical protein DAI22_06g115100 [Oryza sativa Japonica Group]|nr:hypothetical protein DAI22_06g115100 [Oryza sativa Japonica Group]